MNALRRHAPLLATAVTALLLFAAGALAFPRFGSARVVVGLFADNGFLGVAAAGAALVVASGAIDLSAGAVAACASVLVAKLIAAGTPPVVAFLLTAAAGAAFGAVLGTLIAGLKLPAFLVTLAGMFLARGLAFALHPQSLAVKHDFFLTTAPESLTLHVAGVAWPPSASAFVLVVLGMSLVARRTRFGRRAYAIGDDETAAATLGVPVGRTRVMVHAVAGLCSALAGVTYALYTQSGDPAACNGLELDAIAATVIGGASLAGGSGGALGAMLGVLVLGLVQALVAFHGGLNAWWTRIFVGGLVLAFVAVRTGFGRLGARR